MLPRPSSSLYVGGLLPEVSEPNLFEIFNQVGPVISIRVCRDSMTRRSLGYAYVNFQNVTDAERALDTLNYYSIRGKPCRVMWSQRDPSLRKSGVGNIFIKNLDKSIDNKALHDTFSAFGNILSCRVMTDENGESRGFGFVHFETPESADSAIAKVNGMLLKDKKVFVGHHVSRRERTSKYDELKKNFTNVFVKNLGESVNDEALTQMFAPYGKILSVAVMKDESGKSRGFGFVNFETHEEAVNACDEMNEKEVGDKKLFVGRAQKKTERKEELNRKYELLKQERLSKYQGVNLYIKNLDDTIDDKALREQFEGFGTITSAIVQKDQAGVSRGFGFVCFSSSEEATKAVTEMNGRMLGSKPIYVGLAQRKEVRRQQLEAQYAHRAQFRMAQQSGVLGAMYPPPPMYYPMMPPRGQPPFGYQAPVYGRTRYQGGPQPEMMNNYPQGARPSSRTQPQRNPRPTTHQGSRAGPAPGMAQGVPMNQAQGGAPNAQVAQMGGQPVAPNSRKTGNYRYTSNVRNRVDVVSAPPQNPTPDFSHDFSSLSDASPEQQKQMLGEKLYPLIYEAHGEIAAKVTGMLLDMDNSELIHLLENQADLEAKVQEALNVLREAGAL